MYECMGQRFVEKLNGLFSGVLVDKRTGEAILFNDRYGVNRIYWHQRDDETYFASEAKALLSILPDLREFDERGVAQLVTYGCTTAGRTLFRNIELLPNASLWSFKHGTFKKRTYFSPHSWESQPALSVREFSVNFEDTFKRVVRRITILNLIRYFADSWPRQPDDSSLPPSLSRASNLLHFLRSRRIHPG